MCALICLCLYDLILLCFLCSIFSLCALSLLCFFIYQDRIRSMLAEFEVQRLRDQALLKDALYSLQERDMLMKAAEQNAKNMVRKMPSSDMHTQTEFADFCLFDKKDGWMLPISGIYACATACV